MATVMCPDCGAFVARVSYEGVIDVNCRNKRCRSALMVEMHEGKLVVTTGDRPVVVKKS